MSSAQTDYFERARAISASFLFAAGAAAIIGSLLDWVTVAQRPPEVPSDQLDRLPPLSGIEVTDGWFVIAAALVLMMCAAAIVLKARYAVVAFLVSVFMGAIAIGDYRDISGLLEDAEGIGQDPEPGLGLTLVVAAAIVGLIASVAAIAASPQTRQSRSTE